MGISCAVDLSSGPIDFSRKLNSSLGKTPLANSILEPDGTSGMEDLIL